MLPTTVIAILMCGQADLSRGFAPIPDRMALYEFKEKATRFARSFRNSYRVRVPVLKDADISEVKMVLNGGEVTFFSTPVATDSPILEQRWSNVGGLFRDFTYMRNSLGHGPSSHVAIEEDADGMKNVLNGYVRNRLFALGLGFDRYIASVENDRRSNGMRTISGRMRFGTEANCDFTISMCEDGLVRSALLEWKNPEHTLQFVVKTSGTAESHGFRFAKNGTFQEISYTKERGGSERANTTREFTLEFSGFQLLSRDEYANLTNFGRPAGSYLIDHVQGNYSYIDPQGKEKYLSTLAAIKERFSPASSGPNWLWPVVALHALLFAAGAGWYLYRRRRPAVAG